MNGKILIIDDERSVCETLQAALSKKGYTVTWRTSAEEGFANLLSEDFDALVTDIHMRGMSGLELCERVVQNRPDLPVVVITAFGSMDTAIAAIRAGAYDFITKPFETDALRMTLERAVRHGRLREEVKRLRRAVAEKQSVDEIVGASAAMRAVYDMIERVADSTASVLVTGESGTGKELVARALHRRGPRKAGPFVAINCAALPEALLESELFGHARGAFTDARAAPRACSSRPTAARCSSTRSARCRWGSSPSCCAPSRRRSCSAIGDDAPRAAVRCIGS